MLRKRLFNARLPGPLAAALILLALTMIVPVVGAAASGGALWRVVHDLCVPNAMVDGYPVPCSKVDLARGYAIVKDLENPTQLLLVPVTRLTGIEDPKLLAPNAPNYWALAWENRSLLDGRAHRALPRQDVGLVVNSVFARTQNQLHIHIDCARSDVVRTLAAQEAAIGRRWRPMRVKLAGRRYRARWIADDQLGTEDPFRLLAEIPGARGHMERQTLALIGAVSRRGEPGFVLLNDQADLDAGDLGHAEDLLDHACLPLSGEASARR